MFTVEKCFFFVVVELYESHRRIPFFFFLFLLLKFSTFCCRPADAKHYASEMLGQRLITKQTGAEGLPCDKACCWVGRGGGGEGEGICCC